MNKLKITLAIIGIFLIVFATAQFLSIRNVDVEKTKIEKDKLSEYGITTPELSELINNNGTCEFKMYQILPDNSTYNLGMHYFRCNNLTLQQKLDKQIGVADDWLSSYVKVLIAREVIPEKEIISNKTKITITEAK